MQKFIQKIEKAGELLRIKVPVNTEYEIAEIADRFMKEKNGGKALLFENTGTSFPLIINALGSEERMKIALQTSHLDHIKEEIDQLFKTFMAPKNSFREKLRLLPRLATLSSYMPKKISGRGKSQEIVHRNPDLTQLPVLKTWSKDGGPFITLPQVITHSPETGSRNVGMYRMQIFDKNLTGMHWHKHKTGANHFSEYKAKGLKMPIAVALGGDPLLSYVATAPLPENIDEYLLAGFLRKKKVRLVKALTQDIYVPEEADFIIEGYIDPNEDFIWEGPFGDHTGFYSLPDWYPKFHVTCLTHKKNAVYPATLVGIPPMEDSIIARATEKIFLAPIKLSLLPEIQNMHMPDAGVAHNIALINIQKKYPGQAAKSMHALWGAGQMMFNKIMCTFDLEAPIENYLKIAQILSENVEPEEDIIFTKGPLDVLDHASSQFAYGSKMGIDATKKYQEERSIKTFDKISYISDKENIISKYNMIKKINSDLTNKGISCIFIAVKKTENQEVRKLSEALSKEKEWREIKCIIIVDEVVDIFDIQQVMWIFAGNTEPLRDCQIFPSDNDLTASKIIIDATRKRADIDNFQRRWPNVVTSDNKTIERVDKRWKEYEIGPFISSPSLKYKSLIISEEADIT